MGCRAKINIKNKVSMNTKISAQSSVVQLQMAYLLCLVFSSEVPAELRMGMMMPAVAEKEESVELGSKLIPS